MGMACAIVVPIMRISEWRANSLFGRSRFMCNRSLPLCCCRDGWERRERQALARGGDDGAEVAPGGGPTTAAGFDDAGQEREGARPRFGAGTVADVARNYPMT